MMIVSAISLLDNIVIINFFAVVNKLRGERLVWSTINTVTTVAHIPSEAKHEEVLAKNKISDESFSDLEEEIEQLQGTWTVKSFITKILVAP